MAIEAWNTIQTCCLGNNSKLHETSDFIHVAAYFTWIKANFHTRVSQHSDSVRGKMPTIFKRTQLQDTGLMFVSSSLRMYSQIHTFLLSLYMKLWKLNFIERV